MNQPIRKYIKVGLIHFMAYPETMKGEGPIKETIGRILRDDTFDAIEIAWIKDTVVRAEVKKMLDQAHIAGGYGASPRLLTTGLNPNDLDEAGRQRAVATLKEGIDEAYELGAKGYGFLSCKHDPNQVEAGMDALEKTVRELSAYAASKGDLQLLLEVFDYDVDKRSLIGPTTRAKAFCDRVRDLPNFGLMVDLSHIPLMHETIEQSLMPVASYIRHAHMGNAVIEAGLPGYGDQHPRFGFPGSVNDVPELTEYLRALIKIGYLKEGEPRIVSFEVKPFGDEDPELVIANAKRTLNLAWAMV
jgi:sugar phosphate isomerase/epimerase